MAKSAKTAGKQTTKRAPRKQVEIEITRAAFRSDPAAAFQRISSGGRLWITDAAGTRVAVITAPSERIKVAAL